MLLCNPNYILFYYPKLMAKNCDVVENFLFIKMIVLFVYNI